MAVSRTVVLLLLAATAAVQATEEDEVAVADDKGNEGINCDDGLLIPIWPGHEEMSMGDRFGRGLLYGTLMLYLFIGVAIVSDRSATNPHHISHGTSRTKFFISTTLY